MKLNRYSICSKKAGVFLLSITVLFLFITFLLIKQPFGLFFYSVLTLFVISFISLIVNFVIRLVQKKNWFKKYLLSPFLGLVALIVFGVYLVYMIDINYLFLFKSNKNLSTEEWKEDFQYVNDLLKTKHPDIYSLISKNELDSELKKSISSLSTLSYPERFVELFRFLSLPQDAHTFPFVMIPGYDLHSFPFELYEFDDGFYVTRASHEFKDIEGLKILKIGNQTIENIRDNYPVLLAYESPNGKKMRFSYTSLLAEWLVYHKIIDNIKKAEFTFEGSDKKMISKNISSVPFYKHFLWTSVIPANNKYAHVIFNPRKKVYDFKVLDDNAIYLEFNQCENQSKRYPFSKFEKELFDYVAQNEVERLIIDLRKNDGGNTIWLNFIEQLIENKKLNSRGKLYLLVGRRTFSSAVMFANSLQMRSEVYIIGEATGQGPVFYSGPRIYKLPNTGLNVCVSSRLRVAGLNFDKREAIIPDSVVNYNFTDYLNGSDPALNVALSINLDERNRENLISSKEDINIYGKYVLDSSVVININVKNEKPHISMTDFIKGSFQRFESELYSEEQFFTTKWDQLNIIAYNNTIALLHKNDTLQCEKLNSDQKIAFELFDEKKYREACNLISENPSFYVRKYPGLEAMLNTLGYRLMGKDELQNAKEVFMVNTILFPSSFNVFDSYGEILLKLGEEKLAILNYKKSLELNPESKSGIKVLKELGEL